MSAQRICNADDRLLAADGPVTTAPCCLWEHYDCKGTTDSRRGDQRLAQSKDLRPSDGEHGRSRLWGACFDLVQEHARATCLLLRHRLTGSAFALVRVTFETLCRGLWLRHRATDQELADFQEKDEPGKSRTQIIAAIEEIDTYNVGVLGRISKNHWSAMCSYTHGGYLSAQRRNTSRGIEPNYSEEEIKQVILFASVWALVAGLEVFEAAGRVDLCEGVLARVEALDLSGSASDGELQ